MRWSCLAAAVLAGCGGELLHREPVVPAVDVGGTRSVCWTAPDSTSTAAMDTLFLVDTTGSMGPAITNLQASLTDLVVHVNDEVPDARFGVARFDDYPRYAGDDGDRPYALVQPLTADLELIRAGIRALTDDFGRPVGSGGDVPESTYEALFQAATGAGLDSDADGAFDGPDDVAPQPAGFAEGALKVVVLVTDAPFHDPDAGDAAPPGAHGRADAVAALTAAGIQVLGVSVESPAGTHPAFEPLAALATATGAISPEGLDHDDDGAFASPGEIPAGGPLVLTTSSQGQPESGAASMGVAVVEALQIVYSRLDVHAVLGGALPEGVSASVSPPGYEGVRALAELCFDVTLEGEVAAGSVAQLAVEVVILDGAGTVLGTEAAVFEVGEP